MTLSKNNLIIWSVAIVIVIALAVVIISKKSDNIPSISPTPTPAENPDQTGTSPTPELIVKEKRSYKSWVEELDPKSRVIAVYNECARVQPSNLTYKNNTMIMLDNTQSTAGHILTIGEKDYSLAAGTWYLITLSSKTVPVDLGIFCNNIELGSIRLE